MDIREQLILDIYSRSAEEGFDYQKMADRILKKYHLIPKESVKVIEIPDWTQCRFRDRHTYCRLLEENMASCKDCKRKIVIIK